jgi:hypothetical protein
MQGQTDTLIKACLDLKTSLNQVMNQIQLKFNLAKQSPNPEGLLMLNGMRIYRQGIIEEKDEEDAKYQPSGNAENEGARNDGSEGDKDVGMDATSLHPDSNPSASLGIGGDLDTDTAIAYFKTVWTEDFAALELKEVQYTVSKLQAFVDEAMDGIGEDPRQAHK